MYVQKSRYFIVSNNAVTSVLTVVFTYYSFLWSYNQGQALCPDDVASPHLNSPNSRASTPVPFPPRVVLQLTEHCCSSSSPCLFTLPSIHPFYLLCLFFLQMGRPKKPLLLSEQQNKLIRLSLLRVQSDATLFRKRDGSGCPNHPRLGINLEGSR